MTDMKSSGEERVFSTGAVRDSAAKKPMIHLISPFFLQDLGEWLRFACQDRKPEPYPPRNWEKGMPFSETLGSGLRHVIAIMAGDTSEDHIAAIGFCAMALAHYKHEIAAGRMDPAIDDMPRYERTNPSYLCPECKSVVIPADAETGQEYFCPKCSWTSLDAPHITEETMETVGEQAAAVVRKHGDPDGNYPCSTSSPEIAEKFGIPIVPLIVEPPLFYITGPMRGIPFLNFPAFDMTATFARHSGLSVVNPAELDRAVGIDPVHDPESVQRAKEADPNLLGTIIKRDCEAILDMDCDRGDGMILLPGWTESVGARAEVAVALWMKLKFKRAILWCNAMAPDPKTAALTRCEFEDVSANWVETSLFNTSRGQ